MLLHVSVHYILLQNIPLYKYTKICLSTLVIRFWSCCQFGQLWTKLLWIFSIKTFSGHYVLSLLDKYLGIKLLCHRMGGCVTVFQGEWIILYSHQYEFSRLTFSLYLALSIFLTVVILEGEKQCLVVVWICISLANNDVEHLFMPFLAIHKSSFVRYLFESFAHFHLGHLFFCYLFIGVLYML